MTVLMICLFLALLLPYLAKMPLAYAMQKQGRYDNHHPREQQSKLTGFGARALAGHQNAFESAIIFTPAILLAISTRHNSHTIQYLAIAHIIARVIYHLLYLFDKSSFRSIVWGIGVSCAFAILAFCII